jgi:hypothetical protein
VRERARWRRQLLLRANATSRRYVYGVIAFALFPGIVGVTCDVNNLCVNQCEHVFVCAMTIFDQARTRVERCMGICSRLIHVGPGWRAQSFKNNGGVGAYLGVQVRQNLPSQLVNVLLCLRSRRSPQLVCDCCSLSMIPLVARSRTTRGGWNECCTTIRSISSSWFVVAAAAAAGAARPRLASVGPALHCKHSN